MSELPYSAEYAKSARASCRGCKSNIAKEVLRLAVVVQSPMFDGKITHWYHFECFFIKQRPKTVGDIANFDSLRWNDQEKIKEKIANAPALVDTKGAKKGKKRGAEAGSAFKDFTVEYAKSARAVCRGCEQKIVKDEVRISKKDFESDVGKRYGGQDRWHHLDCFVKVRDELEFWASGEELPGFKALSADDQKMVKDKVRKVEPKKAADDTDGPTPAKKMKEEKIDPEEEKELKKQNKLIFRIRDELKSELSKKELTQLIEHNGMQASGGHEQQLDIAADMLTFGALTPCTECKGHLQFQSGVGYKCCGDLSEWVKCQNSTLDPKRKPVKIPKDLKEHGFLKSYKYKERKRVIRIVAPTALPSSVTMMLPGKSEPTPVDVKSKPKVDRPPPPLDNMEFVILGKTSKDKEELKKDIQKLGGKVTTKIYEKVFAVIATQEEVDRMGKRMEQVEECQIDVVPEDFVEEVAKGGAPLTLVKTKALSSWGSAPEKRVHEEKSLKSRSGSMFTKSVPDKVKLKVKGGVAVDPDSGLEDDTHVYRHRDKTVYNCVLSATDIQNDKNSYYKMQILQSDKGQSFWLFRSWGRIGTTIGNNKLSAMGLHNAIEEFEKLFQEKTGNAWADRKNFVKVPGRFCLIDVTYGEEETDGKKKKDLSKTSQVESKLAKPVQDLVQMLFDVDTMKKCMLEFELDLQKMPLGKLSSSQILKAMGILKDLYNYVKSDAKDGASGPNAFARLVEASNRFYTLIPHDFGVDTPPVLNTLEQIQKKIEMLESLLELEIAYKMLDDGGDEPCPLDAHYSKLKADIQVLDRSTEEFRNIETYLKNSHAETHTQYDLEIEDVFKVKRQGEERRYKPFKKLHNRQLLWHGSRLTNFVGIISQGLRIAPPEAPACGYMFGKGIYFADRVSKSANYCMTTNRNPVGLMLLCDVALGNMYERTQADYIEKLPKGKHSCKGVGRTQPKDGIDLDDGLHIPLGPGTKEDDNSKQLLYNEYIVYDVAQVQMKYLLKINFKYKY